MNAVIRFEWQDDEGNILYPHTHARVVFTDSGLSVEEMIKNIPQNFARVATTGNYTDLINRPDLKTVATTGNYNDLINKPALKTVATTGNYNDLINKPSSITAKIPTSRPATLENGMMWIE